MEFFDLISEIRVLTCISYSAIIQLRRSMRVVRNIFFSLFVFASRSLVARIRNTFVKRFRVALFGKRQVYLTRDIHGASKEMPRNRHHLSERECSNVIKKCVGTLYNV